MCVSTCLDLVIVPIATCTATVAAPNTEPVIVDLLQDPRSMVTPINAHKAELLLYTYGIYNSWSHIIAGLHSGFEVGI